MLARLSVRWKLMAIGVVASAALLLVVGFAVVGLRSTTNAGHGVRRESTAMQEIATIQIALESNRALVDEYIALDDAQLHAQIADEIEVNASDTDAARAALDGMRLTADERALLADVDPRLATLREIRQQVLELDEAKADADAWALWRGDGLTAFTAVHDTLDTLTATEERESEAAASSLGSTQTRAVIEMLLIGALGIAAVLVLATVIARGIVERIGALATRLTSLDEHCLVELKNGVEAVAAGDLTRTATPVTTPVEVAGEDEIAALGTTFNGMLGKAQATIAAYGVMRDGLRGLVGEIGQTAETLSAEAEELTATSQAAGRAVEEIAHAVADVAAGAERQTRMVDEAKSAAGTAHHEASDGERTAQHMVDVIGDLDKRSREISTIADTITGIASQTNLLALNAAIEAARAGDMGRGFAVVADEVRTLAEGASAAAAAISRLVDEMQSSTDAVADVVRNEAVGAFARIAGTAGTVDESLGEVATVAEETSAATEQVSASTQETNAAAQEIATAATELAHQAEQLTSLVGRFHL